MKTFAYRRVFKMVWAERQRMVAMVMLPVFFLGLIPPSTRGDTSPSGSAAIPSPVLTPKDVHVSRGKAHSSYKGVQLPAWPSDSDITYSHAFQEPLVPVGLTTNKSEDQALAAAIRSFLQRPDVEDTSALTDFLDRNPNSAWRPSLDLNLAQLYFKSAKFSKALAAWEDAWARTQALADQQGEKVANLAVGQLAEMKARIGRTEELDALYKQIKGRNVSGPAAQLLVQARAGLWLMKTRPQDAFRCGPSALQELSIATKHKIVHPELIKQSRSTAQGISLADVNALAAKIAMPMQMAKRTEGSDFIVPAVIHWKLGHYAALVGQQDGKYIVHDTTFGGARFLVSAKTLEEETSGYFLVPVGRLPQGWTSVSQAEGSKVLGRGNPGDDNPYCLGPTDVNSGDGDCGNGGVGDSETLQVDDNNPWNGDPDGDADYSNPKGDANWAGQDSSDMPDSQAAMTVPIVKSMLVSLGLVDTPVRYSPPLGPVMHFTVHYNQREIAQPATFSYACLGPNWTFSYLSYVTPNPAYATLYERGGGVEVYNDFNSTTNSYSPAQRTGAVLSQINTTTWQKQYPGGEVETFGQSDGAGDFFLTQITDPQGNSLALNYDSHMRLVSLTDAIGQQTSISYVSNTVGNSEFYYIAQVTDPFGRSAQFSYDGSGRLQQITDILGLASQYSYSGSSTFVNSLTTPYGVTKFSYGDNSTDPTLGTTRWEVTTFPDGNQTRTEYNESQYPSGVNTSNGSDSTGVPASMNFQNSFMQYRNTYFWDRQAMASYPGNYAQAQVTHWLHTSDINTCSDVQESIKKPAQNRIWYSYSGAISSYQASDTMLARPAAKGRILDDGSTQLYQYQYNGIGKVTQQIDPLGRQTNYLYYPNNIDLYQVQQVNSASGTGYDLLATYYYNSQHEVTQQTDASGQSSYYSYYPNGQLHTFTDAKGDVTTYSYANNYLTNIAGPVAGATTSFTYDGFGRVQSITDSQGYTDTINYDAADRPTLVTYPDGSTWQTNYHNLDIQYKKDRLGRVTRYFFNSLRQQIGTLDSQGHITNANWSLSAGLSSMSDASGGTTTWKYDNQNRPVEKDYPDGTKELTAYENTTSRVHSITDNEGQIATMTYTSKSVTLNGTSFTGEDNSVESIAYSNATVSTPAVNYSYDPNYARLVTISDSVTGATTFHYNSVTGSLGSNLLGTVQNSLATISYGYDQLGRQISQTVNDSSTGQGLSNNSSTLGYDALGRVTSLSNSLSGSGSFSYAYLNNTNRPTSITYPSGQSTTYTYQDSSTTPNNPWVTEIKNRNASGGIISKFDYGYDSDGEITSWTQQTDSNDPQNWALQYDQQGKLSTVNVTDTVSGATLHQYAYLYDAVGNRTSEQIDGNVTGSTYNHLNQLTGQNAGGPMVFSGNTGSVPSMVTVAGNAATSAYSTNFSGMANVTQGTNSVSVVAHDVNSNFSTNNYQVVIPPASGSFTYDLNGNLLTDGIHTFGWDAKNQLVSIIYNAGANAGNHTEFTYNGLGQRVSIIERTGTTIGSGTITSTKQYLWSGSTIMEERNASNIVTKRYFGSGEQRISGSTPTNYFYTFDHLGSIREMIASDGATIAARYSYDPYGRATPVSGSISCDFEYAGMYMHPDLPGVPATGVTTPGLNLTQFRAYNPNLGRWISRDPSGESSGFNLYAYCSDSPVSRIDPLGLDDSDNQSDDFDSMQDLMDEMNDIFGDDGDGGPGACVDGDSILDQGTNSKGGQIPGTAGQEPSGITNQCLAYSMAQVINNLKGAGTVTGAQVNQQFGGKPTTTANAITVFTANGVNAVDIYQNQITQYLSQPGTQILVSIPTSQPGIYHAVVIVSAGPNGTYNVWNPLPGGATVIPGNTIIDSIIVTKP